MDYILNLILSEIETYIRCSSRLTADDILKLSMACRNLLAMKERTTPDKKGAD